MKFYKRTHTEARRHGGTRRVAVIFLLVLLMMPAVLHTQEGFGFGEDDLGFSGTGTSSLSVNIGGEVSAGLTLFFDDFSSGDKTKNAQLGDILSGQLNFETGGSLAEAVINLKLRPVFDGSSPVEIDEAYVRAFFGHLTVLGGLRKLSWGKADSFGPLDLINPIDYSDLTKLIHPQSVKIARPMIHAAWSLTSFSKLEGVFVPWFQGHKFATSGRWAPDQISGLAPTLVDGLKSAMLGINPLLSNYFGDLDAWQNYLDINDYYSEYRQTLEYAQAGLRFTTTVGASDLGFQYYYGRLQRPRVLVNVDNYVRGFMLSPPQSNPNAISIDIDYNPYHHFGLDYASVIAGFNVRAEAGANITPDLDGNDGTVENPALVWSLGFDRDIALGINLNLQANGRFRLFDGKVSSDPLLDCEAGTDMTSTRITGIVSKKFLRDELEVKATALWGIEDMDFLVMPSIAWSRNALGFEVSAGFFGGDKEGELGQYRDNNFVKALLSYKF